MSEACADFARYAAVHGGPLSSIDSFAETTSTTYFDARQREIWHWLTAQGIGRVDSWVAVDDEELIADMERPTIVMLHTCDKFGNPCTTGGLRIAGRLQLVKQSATENTVLMQNNHAVTVEDKQNGTYAVYVAIMMSAVVKLTVNMDKDMPGSTGELPPLQLAFVKPSSAPEAASAAEVA